MEYVDIYMFPCFSCGNPASQVDQLLAYLNSYNISNVPSGKGPNTYGTLWFDIEGPQYWGSQSANVAFIQGLIAQGRARGISLGVYSSESQWSPITGNANIASDLPIWYPHYEEPPAPNYDDWVDFGGWTKPAIKQYAGTTDLCGASIDRNWYP
jgi:hypothetical protein